MKDEQIAMIAHEVNRSYCQSHDDFSQLSWEDAPERQRESSIKGVKFKRANPNTTPEQIHGEWLKDKSADGWKFGIIKDVDKKEHQCFVPYEKLSVTQRVKDHLFIGVVRACEKI